MRLTALLAAAVVALAPVGAQTKQASAAPVAAKPTGTIATADKPLATIETLKALEKEMDSRISATGGAEPCVIQGFSRGVYVNGVGAVFTAEVELVATPGGVALFPGAVVGAEQKTRIHKTELAHVPMLQQTLRDMVLSLAASPALKLTDTEQIVVAVRLYYQRWEDTTGMPGQIVARLDHRGGTVKVDVQ